MATTGMGWREYSGRWEREGEGLRIHGTKTGHRDRLIPLVGPITRPTTTIFASRYHLTAAGVTPYDLRRTFAGLMVEANIPRPRRRAYMGHTADDMTALYEAQEVGLPAERRRPASGRVGQAADRGLGASAGQRGLTRGGIRRSGPTEGRAVMMGSAGNRLPVCCYAASGDMTATQADQAFARPPLPRGAVIRRLFRYAGAARGSEVGRQRDERSADHKADSGYDRCKGRSCRSGALSTRTGPSRCQPGRESRAG